ncbi:MAG TPA: hypothetical protein VFR81_16980 [Longimicrobium sp.]|nr:hypothetical protein [Longimicrobium sp.]
MLRAAMAISAVLLLWGGSAGAQARAASAGAAPRDVREVFLALPVPPAAPSRPLLSRVAPLLATRELRGRALERALAADIGTVDARNGFLELCVGDDRTAECHGTALLTYFVRAGGERLVVLQVSNPDGMRTEDYFWTLAGGRFTPADPARFLPDLTYADFWGDQPLPRGMTPRFFREMGALTVAWPREGTTAWAYVQPLTEGMAEDDARVERLIELYERRRVSTLALVWDRRRGVFTKGRAMPYDPNGEEDHDHH